MRLAKGDRGALRSAGLFLAGLIALVPAGCDRRPTEGSTKKTSIEATSTKLEGDVLARVGERRIRREEVAAVARARKVDAREAVQLLIEEAVLAEAAVQKGALTAPGTHHPLAACLARTVIRSFEDKARAQGPFTDAELDAAMLQSDVWIELERGEARTVVHALVKAGVAGGAALAERLRAAIVDAPNPTAFLAASQAFAKTVPPGSVVAESLPAFVEDGRVAQKGQGGTMDLTFVKGAFALAEPGDTSEVLETPFGWHVIRLVAIAPPVHAPREKRVTMLAPEVVRARVGNTFDVLLETLRNAAKPEILAADPDFLVPRFDAKPAGSPGT